MVFAIPDWEDGNIKKNNVFSEKAKGKQRNGSPKKSPQKMTTPKKVAKTNGVSDKSKMIHKDNKKLIIKKKHRGIIKKNSTKIWPVETIKAKNGVSNPISQKTGEINNKTQRKQKRNNPKSRNVIKDNSDSRLKVENLDTDKLDEVLLNAKKKKFNEAVRNDDVEALLFKEDKSPEVGKKNRQFLKQKELRQSHQASVENKLHTKNQPYIDNKQKTKHNKIVKTKTAKNNSSTKPIIDKEVSKVKDIANNLDENGNSNEQIALTHQDIKKIKLKQMLKEESNRNPINFNRNKLRERMLDRLKSAQFRFLNEKLYTSSSSEASQLFQNDPSAFQNYHEGYQQQLKKWPVNPLDVIVKRIQKMPKSHLIADMGCGEAALAKRIPHTVRSFDLVATVAGVETCDMAHTPLLTASVDAVVYCLALMGTDLTTYLLEANRVLKMGGHLLIAEVESRFSDINVFTKEVSRLGFKLQKLDNERDVFFFMEFVKNQDPPVKKSKLPVLTLKPCIYKRR